MLLPQSSVVKHVADSINTIIYRFSTSNLASYHDKRHQSVSSGVNPSAANINTRHAFFERPNIVKLSFFYSAWPSGLTMWLQSWMRKVFDTHLKTPKVIEIDNGVKQSVQKLTFEAGVKTPHEAKPNNAQFCQIQNEKFKIA